MSAVSEKLLEIAEDFENFGIPEEAMFSVGDWGYHPGAHHPSKNLYCGTAACLAGWLTHIPKYKEMGFTAEWEHLSCKTNGREWWILQPRLGSWEDLTIEVFGEDVGEALIEIFQCSAGTKEEIIEQLRELAEEEK